MHIFNKGTDKTNHWMRRVYRVARVSSNKVRWEDSIDLPVEWAERIANRCTMRKEGYALDGKILAELLDLSLSSKDRFTLLALLVEVLKGYQIVLFV